MTEFVFFSDYPFQQYFIQSDLAVCVNVGFSSTSSHRVRIIEVSHHASDQTLKESCSSGTAPLHT